MAIVPLKVICLKGEIEEPNKNIYYYIQKS